MSRQDTLVACDPQDALPVGQATRVGVLLVGDTFTVSFNGQESGDPWYPAADVTVANLVYTPLYTYPCPSSVVSTIQHNINRMVTLRVRHHTSKQSNQHRVHVEPLAPRSAVQESWRSGQSTT